MRAAIFSMLISASVTYSQSFTLSHILDDPSPTSADVFGHDVDLDGNYVLVSDRGDDTHGNAIGRAHLFDASSGLLLHSYDDPTPTRADSFGWSLAVEGQRVLIGAPNDETIGIRVGQVHLFDVSGDLLQTFNDPTPTHDDRFGQSVDMDGSMVLVGARRDDTNGEEVGQAHLFDAESGTLIRTFDDPTVTTSDRFGYALAIDGSRVLISAPYDDTHGRNLGQVHLFDAVTGNLVRTFDNPTPEQTDYFGWDVAMDGNNVLIGNMRDIVDGGRHGRAHLFDATTGELVRSFEDPSPTDFDGFGASVDLDGNRALIGQFGDDTNGEGVGRVNLFDTVTGELLQTFDDPTPTLRGSFGFSVSIDGGLIAASAHYDDSQGYLVGQAYLFRIPEPCSLRLLCILVVTINSFCRNRRGAR